MKRLLIAMFHNEKPGLCLFGAGGHGRVVAGIARRVWPGKVIFGDSNITVGTLVDGTRVEVSNLSDVGKYNVLVTVGANRIRRKLQTQADQLGLKCAFLVSDTASYFAADPGGGSMILTSTVVNAGSTIGRGVIINTGAIVEHDCTINDFCHLAPNSVVLGGCTLDCDVFLGANCTVLQGLYICPDVIIGAGAVVVSDIIEPGTYAGVPARRIG
jgi:UDP-N-acetylbacillosamine N-acetyltransferase